MRILLGVTGGIAAYKAGELVRLFRQHGDEVQVVLTRAGARFLTPATLAALSGRPVLGSLFARAAAIEHIAEAQAAAVAVVAPATAHTLARMAHGLADDYLTTLLLATPAPVVVAPAMNVQMWRHAATQANLELLRARGVTVVEPEAGELACGMVGEGRLAAPEAIAAAAYAAAAGGAADLSWAGETVLITAGPTREALDPVRYLSNRSSGRMGYALAAAAARRGATVRLISGPTALAAPAGVARIAVTSAEEMAAAARAEFAASTIVICAAAVADYRPAAPRAEKIKKTAGRFALELVRNPDILAELGAAKTHQKLVGFAAETASDGRQLARAKLRAKRCDLMVFNDVSRPGIGFDSLENAVTLVTEAGEQALPQASKTMLAEQILDAIAALPRHAPAHA